jgi:hypothetical protein
MLSGVAGSPLAEADDTKLVEHGAGHWARRHGADAWLEDPALPNETHGHPKDRINPIPAFPNSLACSWGGCGFQTFSQPHLNAHLQAHAKPFVCDRSDCLRRFSSSEQLSAHMQLHTTPTRYACTHKQCTHRAADADALDEHLRAHTAVAAHWCSSEGCSFKATLSADLQRHIETVSTRKPFRPNST